MKNFNPTQEMTVAAEAVFLAMAVVQTIEPIVTKYQKEILTAGKWFANPELVRRDENPSERLILDPNHSYLLPEASFKEYLSQCKQAREAAGLIVADDDHCPRLVAENELRIAQHALIASFVPTTGLDCNKLLCSGLDNYKRYIDLCLKLLAPFVKNTSAILEAAAA